MSPQQEARASLHAAFNGERPPADFFAHDEDQQPPTEQELLQLQRQLQQDAEAAENGMGA